MTDSLSLHVSSEVAPLRQVLVHTPGEEMSLVSPANKDDLLFGDKGQDNLTGDAGNDSLDGGRDADIIAVQGDVLRYINLLQRVDFVMKGGVVYKRDGQPLEAALAPR